MMDLFRSLARQERREAGLCPSSVQKFIDCLSQSCKDFGLTISIKKTNVDAQDASQAPSINIDEHTLNVVDEFTYLGSTISINLSLDTEINKHIGKASATIAKLTERVWKNILLTQNTKVHVYLTCILSFMAARPGPPTCARTIDSTPSARAA